MTLETAVESKFAKALASFGMPMLLGVIAFLGGMVLNDIRESQASTDKRMGQLESSVNVLNAKLDNGVIWRITELERRLNTVEQAQKTP